LTYLDLFTIYLPISLFIFKNNIPKNDFNIGINLAQSNGPLSISQIVNHYVNHVVSQNDRFQINYLITLVGLNQRVQIDKVVFFYTCHLGIFI